jgi:hypothetical protein
MPEMIGRTAAGTRRRRGGMMAVGFRQDRMPARAGCFLSRLRRLLSNALGRRTSVTDAFINATHTAYDDDNPVIATWGATYPVRYEYDTHDRMTAMRTYRTAGSAGVPPAPDAMPDPAGGDITRWLYDNATGLLTNKLYADGLGTAYTYTPDHKLHTRTWARGITTTYIYAPISGELAFIDYSDDTPDIAYTYDRPGNTVSVTDVSGTRTFSHTPDGQTLTDAIQFQDEAFTLHEAYDAFGRGAGYALSNTVDGASSLITSVALEHDPYGRLSVCSVGNIPAPFRYGWLPNSNLQQSLAMPNGVTRQTTYDPHRDLPSSITHTNVAGIVLTRRTFAYDASSRLTNRTQYRLGDETNRLDAFGYNPRSELTSGVLGTNDYAYVFDPIGNREQSVENAVTNLYAANALNQYTNIFSQSASSVDNFIPVFDADGNQTLIRTSTGVWHVRYNGENRPVCFSNDTAIVDMDYDYMGRRFFYRETVNNTVICHERHLYRDYLRIAALDMLNVNDIIHIIVWDPTEPVATRPLLLSTPSGWHAYGFDQGKNVTETFDMSGGISARYDYEPFGSISAISGIAHILNPLTFSSEIDDLTFDLVYYNWRHLDVKNGRWLSRDPIFDFSFENIFAPKQQRRGIAHAESDYGVTGNTFTGFDVHGLTRTYKNDPSVCEIAKEKGWQGSHDAGFVCYNGDTYMCIWNGASGAYSKGINECIVEHEEAHLNNGDVETCKPCDQKRAGFPNGTTRPQENEAECKAYVATFKCLKSKLESNCNKLAEPAKGECQKNYCEEMTGKANETMLNACLNGEGSLSDHLSHQNVPPCGKIWFPN